MEQGATTINITTISITTLSIIKHNHDTLLNDTQYNVGKSVAFFVLVSVIILDVVILNVAAPGRVLSKFIVGARYVFSNRRVAPLLWRHDILHNDTQHNDTQHYDLQHKNKMPRSV
jgi:hypothetical protein